MIQIKTQELRDAVLATWEFDHEHGKFINYIQNSDEKNLWYSIYEFDNKRRKYYFSDEELIGYEDIL